MTPYDWEGMSAEEMKEAAYAAFVEKYRKDEARRRSELAERSEALLEFVRADDTEDPRSADFQDGLTEVSTALTSNKVGFSRRVMTFDAVDCGGFALPEFVVALKDLGLVAITGVSAVAAAWVQGRNGRKVRLKMGDLEAEGRSKEEIEALLKLAKYYKDTPEKPKGVD